MPSTDSTSQQLYARLCELTGLPFGTPAQKVVDAHVAQWDRRALLAGLPTGATVPDIVSTEKTVRLAAVLRASMSSAPVSNNGVRLLSQEEAQDIIAFGGAQTRAEQRRIEATEDHYGKTLREALDNGQLA